MKKYIYLTSSLLIYAVSGYTQGKIKDGTVIGSPSLPAAGAVFELESSNKGVLLPRVSLSNTLVWGLAGTAVNGMTVYNTNAAMTGAVSAPVISGGLGVYYWDGSRWVAGTGQQKAQADSTYWALSGNAGLATLNTIGTSVGSTHFLGTKDAANLTLGTSGLTRMVIGQNGNAYGGTQSWALSTESFAWGQADTSAGIASAVFGSRNRVDATAAFAAGGNNKLASTATSSAVFGSSNHDSAFNALIAGSGNRVNDRAEASAVFGLGHIITNTGAVPTTLLAGNLLSGGDNQLDMDGNNNVSLNRATHFNIIAGQSNRAITSANCAVFGYNNDIHYSDGSLIAGFNNTMERTRSAMILGYENIDSASHSFVTGQGNIVNPSMSWGTVIGRFNAPMSSALFTVGNGSSDISRSNAFVVTNVSTTGASINGLVVLIPNLPAYASDAAASSDTSLPAGALYKIGNDIRIK